MFLLIGIGKSKLFLARFASQARRARSLFVLSLCVKFFIQFIFKKTSEFDAKWGSPYSGTIYYRSSGGTKGRQAEPHKHPIYGN